MKLEATRAVEAKKSQYMRLESASTFQLIKSLYLRLDVYILAFGIGVFIGLMV